jgi:hypothetical protein
MQLIALTKVSLRNESTRLAPPWASRHRDDRASSISEAASCWQSSGANNASLSLTQQSVGLTATSWRVIAIRPGRKPALAPPAVPLSDLNAEARSPASTAAAGASGITLLSASLSAEVGDASQIAQERSCRTIRASRPLRQGEAVT